LTNGDLPYAILDLLVQEVRAGTDHRNTIGYRDLDTIQDPSQEATTMNADDDRTEPYGSRAKKSHLRVPKFLLILFSLSFGYAMTFFYQFRTGTRSTVSSQRVAIADHTIVDDSTPSRLSTAADHAIVDHSESPESPLPDSIVADFAKPRKQISSPFLLGRKGSVMNLSRRHGAIYIHPGKAGGGTFLDRYRKYWQVAMLSCHPYPCRTATKMSNVLISVRDPVDRFVSGFNWLRLGLCDPFHDKRKGRPRRSGKNMAQFCKSRANLDNAYLVHNKYAGEPNRLAESLCPRDDNHQSGQSDLFPYEEADHDLLRLDHIRHTYKDWLAGMITKKENGIYLDTSTRNISAVVLEHGFDLLSQIDNTLKWVGRSNETTMSIFQKQEQARAGEEELDKQYIKSNGTLVEFHHSVSEYKFPVSTYISKLGQCCVARWYKDDYQILLELRKHGCHGDTAEVCQQAITSIYERRKLYLEDLTKSCHQLAAM